MKKFFILSLAAAALTLPACKTHMEEPTVLPDTEDCGREMISFSMSDAQGATTRAGFTGAATRIVARIQSDATSLTTLYTKTALKAAKDNTTDATALLTSYSTVSYYDGNTRYWDDAYGRKAKLSVYAVAIPNSEDATKLTFEKLAGGATWAAEATPNNSIQWDVTYGTQTSTTLAGEDLVYSNNIQSTGKNGRYVWDYDADTPGYPADNGKADGHKDGQLQFTQKAGALESDAGHFDKGHLMFNHALSRLTITLVEGTDYSSHENDFKFTNTGKNIKLLLFPTAGTLDIKSGTWAATPTITDIETIIGAVGPNAAAGDYSAQMLPGYKFYGTGTNAAKNVMEFMIDNSTYYVTQKQVYDALNITANTTGTTPLVAIESDASGNYIEMKQGKNYKLSITVNKTPIVDVTATLAPWVEVAGSMEVNNAHITLSLNTSGTTCDKDIDLYRLDEDNAGYDADNYDFSYQGKNWFGNYSTDDMHKTTLLHSALSGGKWTTPWFFESNKTYYHFRTVNKGETILGNTGSGADDTNDYFAISAGPVAEKDPHWGAPMKTVAGTSFLKYDDNNTLTNYADDKGYEAFLNPAIGATESQIKIQELHMMSNINVVLETPSDGGKVQLYKPAVLYTYAEYKALDGKSETTEESFNNLSEAEKTKEAAVGTVIKITRLATTGQVEMGRGVVTPTAPSSYATSELTMTSPSIASASDYYATNDTKSKPYSFAVVPQSLSRNFSSTSDNDYVGIFIQTPDHNQYYVVKKLSEITATTVTDERNQTKDQPIKRWYPGHTYTYTFTITKTGIKNVTATVADWVTVTGKPTDITLED